jgi:hypothetical protein
MKISGFSDDPEYSDYIIFCKVLFNGREVRQVVRADDTHGTCTVQRMDDFGKYIINPDGNILLHEMFGRVQIIFSDPEYAKLHTEHLENKGRP